MNGISPEDWVALHQLSSDHWKRVDRISARPVHELYLEDGKLILGKFELHGHAALEAYFVDRFAQADETGRTTRHIISGFLVEPDGPDAVIVQSTATIFVGIGEAPFPTDIPSSIGDFTDRCVRRDGKWLYEYRSAKGIFTGGPNAGKFPPNKH